MYTNIYTHIYTLLKYLKQIVKAFLCSENSITFFLIVQAITAAKLGIIWYLKKLRRPNKALHCNGESEAYMSFLPYSLGEI